MPVRIIQHKEDLLKKEKRLFNYGMGGSFRVCLAYPNTYHAGMSSLGFQHIYHTINTTPDFYCDRTFLPDSADQKLYAKGNRKLFGYESERPLQQFDMIAFSVSYELDYFNILKMLDLAAIPHRAKDRDESFPLIAAGGEAVSINPEPVADFVDLFFIGEGEKVIADFMDLLKEKQWNNRKEFLKAASTIKGIYVPSLLDVEYDDNGLLMNNVFTNVLEPVSRSICTEMRKLTHSIIVTPETEFSDVFLVETARGCPYNCAYCCVSLNHKPYRFADFDDLIRIIDQGLKITDKIGLLGAAVGSHPRIGEILDYIYKKGGKVSFSSLRADALNKELLEKLHLTGQNLLTLAPETGSDRLRGFINKRMTNENLVKTAQDAIDSGFTDIRLYFMLGLPGETDDDVEEGIRLIEEIEPIVGKKGGRVLVSVNQFIPKPCTPLEEHPLFDEEIVNGRIEKKKSAFYRTPAVNFKIEARSETLIQAFLSRGNRRWSGYIEKFYNKTSSNAASKIRKLAKKDLHIRSLVFEKQEKEALFPWRVIGG